MNLTPLMRGVLIDASPDNGYRVRAPKQTMTALATLGLATFVLEPSVKPGSTIELTRAGISRRDLVLDAMRRR